MDAAEARVERLASGLARKLNGKEEEEIFARRWRCIGLLIFVLHLEAVDFDAPGAAAKIGLVSY